MTAEHRGSENREIGIVMPSLSSEYYNMIVSNICHEMRKKGCDLLQIVTMVDPVYEMNAVKRFRGCLKELVQWVAASDPDEVNSLPQVGDKDQMPGPGYIDMMQGNQFFRFHERLFAGYLRNRGIPFG